MRNFIFLLLISHTIYQSATAYKPVVLVHGLLSNAKKMVELEDMILKYHPGTAVTSLNLYPGLRSFRPLHIQLRALIKEVKTIMETAKEGIHLVCHSQGGLLCRGLVEGLNSHNVHSLILLGSPFVGQFGIPKPVLKYLPFLKGEREGLTKFMYTYIAQVTISFANYWRDPRTEYKKEYENRCTFLPPLDNNPKAKGYNKLVAKEARENFLKLDRIVLVGGKDDGVIIPWQSSIGEFYGPNFEIAPLKEQEFYIKDWFGLKTMNERGCLHVYEIPGIKHPDWHKDPKVFKVAIEKYLD